MGYLRFGLVAAAFVGVPAVASVTYFTDHSQFTQFNTLDGKFMKFFETFEESTAGVGEKTPFPNTLQHGVPQPTFVNGIDATNLIIQTNITPGASPPLPNPSANARALWVNGPGFLGSNSVKVGNDEFLNGLDASIDLIFTTHDKTGIGLDVSTYAGFNAGHAGFVFTAYDQFNNLLGSYLMAGATPPEPNKNFFGIWSSTPIGRLNVYGIFSQPQPMAIDNIEMWVPAPGAASLLGLGALGLLRRRR